MLPQQQVIAGGGNVLSSDVNAACGSTALSTLDSQQEGCGFNTQPQFCVCGAGLVGGGSRLLVPGQSQKKANAVVAMTRLCSETMQISEFPVNLW